MIICIRGIMNKSINDYDLQQYDEWVLTWPGQVIHCVSHLYWATDIESTISQQDKKLQCIYDQIQVISVNSF